MNENYCQNCDSKTSFSNNFCSQCGNNTGGIIKKDQSAYPLNYKLILVFHGIIVTLLGMEILSLLVEIPNKQSDMQIYELIGISALTIVFLVPPSVIFLGLWQKNDDLRRIYLVFLGIISLIALPIAIFELNTSAFVILVIMLFIIYTLHFDQNVKLMFMREKLNRAKNLV